MIIFSYSSNPYYLWEVAGVVPCRKHTVRLYLGENFIEVQLSIYCLSIIFVCQITNLIWSNNPTPRIPYSYSYSYYYYYYYYSMIVWNWYSYSYNSALKPLPRLPNRSKRPQLYNILIFETSGTAMCTGKCQELNLWLFTIEGKWRETTSRHPFQPPVHHPTPRNTLEHSKILYW